MDAYLVRLNANQSHPREIVGIFVALHTEQLHHLIDECCDLDAVEYLKMGPGGIFWGDTVDFVVPYSEEGADQAPSLPSGASMTDGWLGAFFDENVDAWDRPVLA